MSILFSNQQHLSAHRKRTMIALDNFNYISHNKVLYPYDYIFPQHLWETLYPLYNRKYDIFPI